MLINVINSCQTYSILKSVDHIKYKIPGKILICQVVSGKISKAVLNSQKGTYQRHRSPEHYLDTYHGMKRTKASNHHPTKEISDIR